MKIHANVNFETNVDVSKENLFRGIAQLFGIEKEFSENSYGWSKVITRDGKKILVTFRDSSYHGSCSYEEVAWVYDTTKIEAFELLTKLKTLSMEE